MVNVQCVDPCPPNPVTPIPGIIPPLTACGTECAGAGGGGSTTPGRTDVGFFVEGGYTEDAEMVAYTIPANANLSIPANFADSRGNVNTILTDAILEVFLNGVEIGQIDISGGNVVFSPVAETALAENDLLTVVAASDQTIDLLSVTIVLITSP